MKTVNILLGLALFCPTLMFAQSATTLKPRKLQLGTFVEFQKEFRTNPIFNHKNILGTGLGVAARYRLSNTFSIASGLGASLAYYSYEAEPMDYYGSHYEPTSASKEKVETTQYCLKLPVTLQTNLYKQKLFISAGVELYKNVVSRSNIIYTEIATGNTSTYSGIYKGGSVDAQLLAGFGYNFNVFKENALSLEANLKMYILGGFTPATASNTYTPSLRLNWYFVK